jgi:hypothetical protein
MYISGAATFGARQADPIEIIPWSDTTEAQIKFFISIPGFPREYRSRATMRLGIRHGDPKMIAEKLPGHVKTDELESVVSILCPSCFSDPMPVYSLLLVLMLRKPGIFTVRCQL